MKDPGDGLHEMLREDYDSLSRVNWSTAKLLGKSPMAYHHALLNGGSDSHPKRRGRATHVAVFEPDRFRSDFVSYEGRRGTKAWEAFEAENADREILTGPAEAECLALAKAARSCPAAVPYLSNGRSELTVLWTFERAAIGGVPGYSIKCKSRLDFEANVGALVDFKTTRDASPAGFGRECARYEYHVQAALYRHAYFKVTGKLLPYVLVATEVAAPHATQPYEVHSHALELGQARFTELFDLLHHCRSQNSWPAYGDSLMQLELPSWLQPDDDESDDLTGLLKESA